MLHSLCARVDNIPCAEPKREFTTRKKNKDVERLEVLSNLFKEQLNALAGKQGDLTKLQTLELLHARTTAKVFESLIGACHTITLHQKKTTFTRAILMQACAATGLNVIC
jgi:hypothetical protein